MSSEANESRMPGLPSLFTIPQQYRNSLPADVQTWLESVESRIDGLHLEHIEEEAQDIAGGDPVKARNVFWIARRIFFRRIEEIIRILDPETGELGIDLPLGESYGATPGFEADRMISEYEDQERREEIRASRELAAKN